MVIKVDFKICKASLQLKFVCMPLCIGSAAEDNDTIVSTTYATYLGVVRTVLKLEIFFKVMKNRCLLRYCEDSPKLEYANV